jgi:hypothetical protein
MRALGWTMMGGGFLCVAYVSIYNPLHLRAAHAHEYSISRQPNYTRAELQESLTRLMRDIERRQISPVWGGVAMLAGALWLTVGSGREK